MDLSPCYVGGAPTERRATAVAAGWRRALVSHHLTRSSVMFWKLFGVYGLLTALALGLLGWWTSSRAVEHALAETQTMLDRTAVLAAEVWRQEEVDDFAQPDPERPSDGAAGDPELQARVVRLGSQTRIRITLIAEDGRVLADSQQDPARMENHGDRPEVRDALRYGSGTRERYSTTLEQDMMYVARRVPVTHEPTSTEAGSAEASPIRSDAPPTLGVVRTSLALEAVHATSAALVRMTWIVVGLATLGVLAAAYYLTRRFVGPLEELTAAVQAFRLHGTHGPNDGGRSRGGQPPLPLFGAPTAEVRRLAAAFQEMRERLTFEITQTQAERDRTRSVLEGMIEGVVAIDAQGRIALANPAAHRLLGLEPRAGDVKIWEIARSPELNDAVDELLAGRDSVSVEITLPAGLGRRATDTSARARRLAVHGVRLGGVRNAESGVRNPESGARPAVSIIPHAESRAPHSPSADTHGAVLVFHDITELRRLERMRQEFVANVTHELKTPLTSIRAHTETLLGGGIDDPQHAHQFLRTIEEQATRLERLIQDMLDLSRLESGAFTLRRDDVRVEDVCRTSAERQLARATARRQEVVVEGPGDLMVLADPEGLQQVLDNLLGNALQYTPEGGQIAVRWRAEHDAAVIEVTDTGIGIPAAHQARIFERFYRVDRARSREAGGTGLGLAIVKHLVQAMRGTVAVASKPGAGTTFTVRLQRSE